MNKVYENIVGKLNLSLRRKVPQVLQTEAAECGLASLAMVCGYYGMHIDMLSMRQKFDISARGAPELADRDRRESQFENAGSILEPG